MNPTKPSLLAVAALLLVQGAAAGHQDDTAERDDPECVGPQQITAEHDGPAHVISWSAFAGADSYNLYRSEIVPGGPAGGGFDVLATVDGNTTTYHDSETETGATYRYFVTAVVAGEETDACNIVETTAIPVFPSAVAAGLAGVVGIAGYAVLRRR